MSKFIIIYPSQDRAVIEGSFAASVISIIYIAGGRYGLEEVNDKLEPIDNGLKMPVMNEALVDDWLKTNFNKSFNDLVKDTSEIEVASALVSTKLVDEQTDSYNVANHAFQIGQRMLTKITPMMLLQILNSLRVIENNIRQQC